MRGKRGGFVARCFAVRARIFVENISFDRLSLDFITSAFIFALVITDLCGAVKSCTRLCGGVSELLLDLDMHWLFE